MKNILLLYLTVLTFHANAQTAVYHPFPDSNAVWHEEGAAFNGPGLEYHWREEYYINGDTTVGSLVYHKIYGKRIEENVIYTLCWNFTAPLSKSLIGGIRQNILSKQVYFNSFGYTSSDLLIYDFNLSLGDTLPPGSFNHNYTLVVNGIDSIFDGSNYRRRFFLSSGVYLIEGIGSTFGLLSEIDHPFEVFVYLHCFEQNNSIIYNDSCLIGCSPLTSVNNISLENIPVIFSPNPFHSFSTLLVNSEFENADLLIYNRLCEQVKYQKINNQSTIINRDGLFDGIYFFQVINKTGQATNGKFIIE